MSPIPKGSPRPRPRPSAPSGPALGDAQPSGSTAELIARHLAGRSLVVVLDNCEHVIDEAASLAQALVGAVPGLRLVATSREPLGVPGEFLIPVAGLACRRLPSSSSWIVLVRCSQASTPDGPAEAIIDGICRRLDGLPLAIELAAARLRALPLSTLAERLDDRFALLSRGARTALPRQQTLRAVVDWSYDLLFDDERRLFARLSVFVGGCELDAVEAVCVDDEVPEHRCPRRHEPAGGQVARHGPDQPARPGSPSCRRCGSTAPTASTTPTRPTRFAPGMRPTTASSPRTPTNVYEVPRHRCGSARLTPELANLKVALDWHLDTGDIDAALLMVSGMAWLWFVNSDFAEGARWLASALGAEGKRRAELHATAQVWHGYFVGMSSSPASGVVECDQAIVVLRSGVDRVRLAEALLLGATVLIRAYEFSRSLRSLG